VTGTPRHRSDRVAVTGAGGRLGRALVAVLGGRPEMQTLPWHRRDFDLDAPEPRALLERDRPSLVIHAAAWTDVDACARNPSLALRRNGDATGELAEACATHDVGLVVISTNEVFDGLRTDGRGYVEDDHPRPSNAYGASKLAAEVAALHALESRGGLWIVRTAWLFGPPGADFPAKVVAAADRLPADEALPAVVDETGSPTFTADLAEGIVALLGAKPQGGLFHLVNAGAVTRYEWAAQVLRRCRPGRGVRPVPQGEYLRSSQPPRWSVLDASRAAGHGVHLRDWQAALAGYLDSLC
jgi:dTDP-4-dehydrorhamnose reductase